jgi:hypothetical protein
MNAFDRSAVTSLLLGSTGAFKAPAGTAAQRKQTKGFDSIAVSIDRLDAQCED